ncbi:hypothetical protein HZ326_30212 [Fusarium oxysporum f. sp. albedinis]|nr:hypothetical protein HZ326_30212 [Fusarium oxysporum f. sp. albedinis]
MIRHCWNNKDIQDKAAQRRNPSPVLETEVPLELADSATRHKRFPCLAIDLLSVLITPLTHRPWRCVVRRCFLAQSPVRVVPAGEVVLDPSLGITNPSELLFSHPTRL